ncbi:hypothetical protein FPOA_03501 [Fusarium poae]|uniref:Uncharacterized protein n=1 Tax=Fusarium poae TaxID=36050 RepID=A0A1B8BA23_FUSPO|nr:hypothetical protein FPOA_03501 [Fusarium poae]
MKLSLSLVYFNVMAVVAASQLFCVPRGFPDCQDGEGDALFTIHSSPRGCIKACYLEEQMENDNHGKRCKATTYCDTPVPCLIAEDSPGNVTLRFFTDDQDCNSNDIEAPVLTTRDIPSELICFNLTDTFSPGNRTTSGYQQALAPWEDPNSNISFHLQRNDFDSSSNYSQIRYELPGVEIGETSSWMLWVYPHLNCDTEIRGVDIHEYPWYQVDCQTEEAGECQDVDYTIQSFAILNGDRDGECKTWAQLGDATRARGQITPLLYNAFGMVVAVLVM